MDGGLKEIIMAAVVGMLAALRRVLARRPHALLSAENPGSGQSPGKARKRKTKRRKKKTAA